MINIIDRERMTLNTTANAIELALCVVTNLVGEELGDTLVTEQGRAGVATMISSHIQQQHTSKTGV